MIFLYVSRTHGSATTPLPRLVYINKVPVTHLAGMQLDTRRCKGFYANENPISLIHTVPARSHRLPPFNGVISLPALPLQAMFVPEICIVLRGKNFILEMTTLRRVKLVSAIPET